MALQGTRKFEVTHMALRRHEIVVLVGRRGEYYLDVVYDACAIMWALQRTSVKAVGPCFHSVTGWNPQVAGKSGVAKHKRFMALTDAWLCFATPNFQHFLHLTRSPDAK